MQRQQQTTKTKKGMCTKHHNSHLLKFPREILLETPLNITGNKRKPVPTKDSVKAQKKQDNDFPFTTLVEKHSQDISKPVTQITVCMYRLSFNLSCYTNLLRCSTNHIHIRWWNS